MTQMALPSRALQANIALRRAVAAYKEGRPSWEERELERRALRERLDELEQRHNAYFLDADHKTSLVSELHRLRTRTGELERQLRGANSEVVRLRSALEDKERQVRRWSQRVLEVERSAKVVPRPLSAKPLGARQSAPQQLLIGPKQPAEPREEPRACTPPPAPEVAKQHEEDAGLASPLHMAACSGHLEVVRLLCDSGCDKNQADGTGATPLHIASCRGHSDVVKLLCAAGADKDRADRSGATPLHIAACVGHPTVVEVLCEAGADTQRADSSGTTPLHIAAHMGHIETVRCLLEAGADPCRAAHTGATPLVAASRRGHKDIARLLRKAEAWPLRNRCVGPQQRLPSPEIGSSTPFQLGSSASLP